MKFKEWYAERGPDYLRQRVKNLLIRYHLTPSLAMRRIDECVQGLLDEGCSPTFPTPGVVVERYPQYFRHLQDAGVEIAVHGYQHVALKAYPVKDACEQLEKAVRVFGANGINVHGFRCPYLGCTNDLLDALPVNLFSYSSNQAIFWGALDDIELTSRNSIFNTLLNVYHARPSSNTLSVPWTRPNMLEIPIFMPDDMELLDGLNFSPEKIINLWSQILSSTHQRGELFNLIFHPELADLCEQPFVEILRQAKMLQPQVWIARLCDISAWWAEKASFRLDVTPSDSGIRLDFTCSPSATILVKGFNLKDSGCSWDGVYQRVLARSLELPATPRPFVGHSPKIPQKVISFLLEQGYLLDASEQAAGCSIYLDETILARIDSEVQLIDYLEAAPGPLVRYWRWPNGAKSVLSITGDLDALSLIDYLSRLH